MKYILIAGVGALLMSAGNAGAQDRYGYDRPQMVRDCPDESYHRPEDGCLCDKEAVFYRPTGPWADIRVQSPGVRVYGRPVCVASGRIDIQGPPVYVDAPPVRIAAPQIYLHRPQVYVRPSEVTVEPPQIHYSGCEDGTTCAPLPPGGGPRH